MRLAADPAAFAWALHPRGHAARAMLLQHEVLAPAGGVAALRALRPRIEAATGLARGEAWDLLEGLLRNVHAVPEEEAAEFAPLAARLVPPACAPALALALAFDVDTLLAGDASFAAQRLVPVRPAWPPPRQRALP